MIMKQDNIFYSKINTIISIISIFLCCHENLTVVPTCCHPQSFPSV